MNSIQIKRFAQKVLTFFVLAVFTTAGSMVTFATESKPVGELLVTGTKAVDGSSVTVNGEPAGNGRTIFSPSTISTPESSGAVINLGKAGKIQLGPNSKFLISADGQVVGGDLTAGSLTVLNATQTMAIKTATGEVVSLNAGETISATSTASSKKAAPGPGGLDWAYWALIIGGAAAAIIIVVVATGDDNNNVSPVR